MQRDEARAKVERFWYDNVEFGGLGFEDLGVSWGFCLMSAKCSKKFFGEFAWRQVTGYGCL